MTLSDAQLGIDFHGAFGTRRIIDLAAAAGGADVRRGASGEVVAGHAIALLYTGRDVALMRAGGMIPMILRQALGHSAASSI